MVPDLTQAGNNRPRIGMAQPHSLPVGIGPVNVADVRGHRSDGCCAIGFLNVHVKQIAEQANIMQAALLEKIGGIGLAVEEIRLVAVERFVEQRLAVATGFVAQRGQRISQQIECFVPRNGPCEAALHRANDRRCAARACGVDDAGDKVGCLRAHAGLLVTQMEFVFDPTGSGSNGGQLQAVGCQEALEFCDGKRLATGGQHLNGVVAELRGNLASGGETIVEDKRTLPGLGQQADRNG